MHIPVTPGKVECTRTRKTLKATIYMNTNNKFYYCHFVMVNEECLPLEWSSGQPCIIMINYPGYRLF